MKCHYSINVFSWDYEEMFLVLLILVENGEGVNGRRDQWLNAGRLSSTSGEEGATLQRVQKECYSLSEGGRRQWRRGCVLPTPLTPVAVFFMKHCLCSAVVRHQVVPYFWLQPWTCVGDSSARLAAIWIISGLPNWRVKTVSAPHFVLPAIRSNLLGCGHRCPQQLSCSQKSVGCQMLQALSKDAATGFTKVLPLPEHPVHPSLITQCIPFSEHPTHPFPWTRLPNASLFLNTPHIPFPEHHPNFFPPVFGWL